MTLSIYRASAYLLQRLDTPDHQRQPEVHVFVEARSEAHAQVLILRTLSELWGCSRAQIELQSLHSEGALVGDRGMVPADMGDAALLATGWWHGPLFCKAEHTLILTSPLTLARQGAALIGLHGLVELRGGGQRHHVGDRFG